MSALAEWFRDALDRFGEESWEQPTAAGMLDDWLAAAFLALPTQERADLAGIRLFMTGRMAPDEDFSASLDYEHDDASKPTSERYLDMLESMEPDAVLQQRIDNLRAAPTREAE